MEYLSETALNNLQFYRYGATDKSLISKYIMKPYWDWAITLFPMSLAPNLITLLGFCFILVNYATLCYFIPDLVGPAPYPVIYFSFAFGLFMYSTFDNVDGRQARRTKSSSALGELFDHGIDSLNCCFGSIIQGAALGLGHSWRTLMIAFLTMGSFYPVTWEEYHTGSMNLGIINGPTEGILMGVAMMIISGIFGPQVFTTKLSVVAELLGLTLPAFLPEEFAVVDFVIIFMTGLLFFFQYPLSIYTVWQHKKATKKPFWGTLPGLSPSLVFFAICYFWLSSPDSIVISGGYVNLFTITFGFAFARVVSKIILAYVTKSRYPYYTFQFVFLLAGAININARSLFGVAPYIDEIQFVQGCLVFNVIAFFFWAKVIIDAFCQHLKIRAFVIPSMPKEEKKAK